MDGAPEGVGSRGFVAFPPIAGAMDGAPEDVGAHGVVAFPPLPLGGKDGAPEICGGADVACVFVVGVGVVTSFWLLWL